MEGGVGEHRQHVQQEPGVGLGQLGAGRQLDRTWTGSQQTRGGTGRTRRTSSPPSSSSYSAASVVGAAVVLVARSLSTHIRATLLLVVVMVVIAVMMNVSLVCLYVKVRGRMMMMRWLDGRMMMMVVVVEGRLV